MTTEHPRILFVDDEPHLLAGIRRVLRRLVRDWDVQCVASGGEALNALAAEPFDAVVSDMRMPGMNGSELLSIVQQRYPATARIVLSGEAERSTVLAAAACAHQFLNKPCDAETVVAVIERVLAARGSLSDPHLQKLIGGATTLPTLPDVYHRLVEVASSPDCSLDKVAQIVGSDVATSAEVLKLTNSAFFGLSRKIETVAQAVSMLGIDNIQALVVAGSTFRAQQSIAGLDIKVLRGLALLRAAMIRRIGVVQQWKQEEVTPLALAAMLREVGLLVLATGHPAEARHLIEQLMQDSDLLSDPFAVHDLEVTAFGCSVAQASAYLLGLWGFSPRVVHLLAGLPVNADDPGAQEGDIALMLAHQRTISPNVVVRLPPGACVSADVFDRWNAACDEALGHAACEGTEDGP